MFDQLDSTPLPTPPDDLVPLPVPAGTLVVLHGLLRTGAAPTARRSAATPYSVHCIAASADYPEWNWLQRPADMPLRRLDGTSRPARTMTPMTTILGGRRRCCCTTTSTVVCGRRTVVELAEEFGYSKLPTTDVDELSTWFNRGAKRNDLVLYLETFAHTVGVMQHRDAIERVAAECAEDLAADGVVYAEVRFAPELHIEHGLTIDEVLDAVLAGFARGVDGTDLTIYTICSAMRTAALSRDIAELAVRNRDRGVVGFDIAGAEAGYPPSRHLDAFHRGEPGGAARDQPAQCCGTTGDGGDETGRIPSTVAARRQVEILERQLRLADQPVIRNQHARDRSQPARYPSSQLKM